MSAAPSGVPGASEWAAILRMTRAAIAIDDPGTDRITYATPSFAAMHGYAPDEIAGRPVAELYAPESLGELPRHVHRADEERVYVFEATRRRRDGGTFPARIDLRGITDERGSLLYRIVTCEDLSSRQRQQHAQRELLAERERARAAEREALEASQRAVTRLQALGRIGDRINRATTLDAVLHTVVDGVEETLGADTVTVLLLEPGGQALRPVASRGLEGDVLAGTRVPVGSGIAGRVAATRAPLILDDLAGTPPVSVHMRQRVASLVAVPLVIDDRLVGVLHAGSSEPRHFGEDDRTLLELMGARAASAIVRAQAYEAERVARDRAERLQRLAAALTRPLTRAQVADVIVGHVVAALGAYAAGVVEFTEESGEFVLLGLVGFADDVRQRYARFPVNAPLPVGEVARTRKPVYLSCFDEWITRFSQPPRLPPGRDDGAWAALPLLAEDRLIGAITLVFDQPRAFEAEDRALMQAFADQCALGLERARLHEASERERKRMALLVEASRAMAGTLDLEKLGEAIVRLAVPQLGDYAVLYTHDGVGGSPLVATHHVDPARRADLQKLVERWPPDAGSRTPAARALATGTTLHGVITPEQAEALAREPRQAELLAHIGAGSYVAVAVRVEERTLGTFSVVSRDRVHDADDIALVEELARRLAPAVENAGLFRAVEEANRAKMQFLATMSHELRTPLNAIAGYIELLTLGIHGPVNEQQAQALGRVQRSQRHLLSLINDVLNFARVDAGHLDLHLCDVPLDEALRALEPLVLPQLAAKSLRYERRPAGDLQVVADAEKLQQVLINLLSNAVKFTSPGGTVTLWCDALPDRVAIHVRDTGRGVPPDQLGRIFEPFVQVGRSLSTPHEGTGLGLAISRELARGMGGDLTATSDGRNGSTFTLTLRRA